MVFTAEQKIKIVQLWYETKSYVMVRRRFCREFSIRSHYSPKNNIIHRFVNHFETKGTVHNTHKGNSGRPAAVTRNQANIDAVRESSLNSPKKSHRRRSQELGLSASSVFRIMKRELKLYPYIITVHHKLKAEDMQRRRVMCEWLSQKLERTPGWINHIWFSDEAHFHINGAINNHNNIFWGSQRPDEVTERQLKGPKVTAFVAYNARHGLLGPYWFEEGGRTVTITSERYCEVIARFHSDLIAILTPGQIRMAWFMQDGASPHTAHATIAHLQQIFNNRLLALGTNHEWAPHSPDLNPLDFWFWGAIKGSVYVDKPNTTDLLKLNVANYLQQVTPETLRDVGRNFRVRIKACLNRRGAHIENVHYRKLAA